MNLPVQTAVDELLPLVRQFASDAFGIVLGGAHAKGTADPESDLDLYVFSQTILSGDRREQLVADFSARVDGVASWGEAVPFVQGALISSTTA